MPPLKLRKPVASTPRPATNPWTGVPYGAPRQPSDAELSAIAAGQAGLGTRRTPGRPSVGFAPGTGVVPSQAMYDHWAKA